MKKAGVKFYAALLCCVSLALCLAVQIYANQQIRMDRDASLACGEEALAQVRAELEQERTARTQLEERLEAKEEALAQAAGRDNPIDRYYFSEGRESGSTILEMMLESSFYRQAWEREFAHAVEWVRENCATSYEKDRLLLEEHRRAVEAQAQRAAALTGLHVAGGYAPEERLDYSVLGRMMWVAVAHEEAAAYRQGTFWLLDTYSYAVSWKTIYPFGFHEETRREILEEMGAPLDIELFPPLAQVLEGS